MGLGWQLIFLTACWRPWYNTDNCSAHDMTMVTTTMMTMVTRPIEDCFDYESDHNNRDLKCHFKQLASFLGEACSSQMISVIAILLSLACRIWHDHVELTYLFFRCEISMQQWCGWFEKRRRPWCEKYSCLRLKKSFPPDFPVPYLRSCTSHCAVSPCPLVSPTLLYHWTSLPYILPCCISYCAVFSYAAYPILLYFLLSYIALFLFLALKTWPDTEESILPCCVLYCAAGHLLPYGASLRGDFRYTVKKHCNAQPTGRSWSWKRIFLTTHWDHLGQISTQN